MQGKTPCPAPDWTGQADRARTPLSAGRTYQVRPVDRFGKPHELAGLLVTLARVYAPEPGLDECTGFVHASVAALAGHGHSTNLVEFSQDELEPADGEPFSCPACGAMVLCARGIHGGGLLFLHDDTGHVILEGL